MTRISIPKGGRLAALFLWAAVFPAGSQAPVTTDSAETETDAIPSTEDAAQETAPEPPRRSRREKTALQPVTFCSWNVRNWIKVGRSEEPRQKGETKGKAPAEVRAVLDILEEIRPDILGVCEMGDAADLAALQTGLKERGIDLPHSELVIGADDERHLALLSRFPITEAQAQTQLTYVLDSAELPVQRGFLDATVQVNTDYRLRLVGAHLKSRRDVPEGDEALMRRNEAHLLRRHLDTVLEAAPDANLLVFGDFNETPDQPAIRAIKGIRGSDSAVTELDLADDRGERWTYYFGEAETYSRIDYIFASRGILPEFDPEASHLHAAPGWLKASDHRPEVVRIHPAERTRRPSRR